MNANVTRALEHEPTGDLLKYFSLSDNIIEANSGIHDNKCLSIDASDTQCPVQQGMFTKLKLTDESIHITNIDKSSITALVRVVIKPTEQFWLALAAGDIVGGMLTTVRDKMTRWFIGLKASSHLFDAYRVYSRNRKTDCEQSTAIHENAAIRMLKAQEELDCKPGVYTLWEDAFNMNENVCGTYFSLYELRAAPATGLIKEFEITLPIDDLLPFSGMKMFPNALFGNLILELKMAIQQNFVVCQCNMGAVGKKVISRQGKYSMETSSMAGQFNNLATANASIWDKIVKMKYSNSFTQIGDIFKSHLINFTTDGSTADEIMVSSCFVISGATMLRCCSNINGFNIKDQILAELMQKYYHEEDALIIPAQYVENSTFSQAPGPTGLKCNGTSPMTNVSAIMILFPRTPNELTCSRNPLLSSLQFLIDNRPYPDKPFSSVEQSHAIFNITNAGLDGLFSPNKEFAYSLVFNELGIDAGDNAAYYGPEKDNTSYCFLCATERLSGYGTFCDGVTKDNAHTNLNGTLLPYTTLHPYLKDPVTGDTTTRYPIMLLCQDCFWRCSVDKGAEFVVNKRDAIKKLTGTD